MAKNCYFEFKDKIVVNKNDILTVSGLKQAFCDSFNIPFSEASKMKMFFNDGSKNKEIELNEHIENFEFLNFHCDIGLDKTIRLKYESNEDKKKDYHGRNIKKTNLNQSLKNNIKNGIL